MTSSRLFTAALLLFLPGCPISSAYPPAGTDAATLSGDHAGSGGQAQGGAAGQAVSGAAPGGNAGGVAGAGGAGGGAVVSTSPTPIGKPLAAACAANSECASGFCVDNVCCNTACDDQCSTCTGSGEIGYCGAQTAGDDTRSAETCTGARTCSIAIPLLNIPACRLKDLQACKTNSDCSSLLCQTFYVDRDGDGYGDSRTTLKLCETAGAAPPAGYVTRVGDCCDTDGNAHPGQTKYFQAPNGCGSLDYDCDGAIQGSNGLTTLGTVPATECGQTVHGSCTSCTQTISCH